MTEPYAQHTDNVMLPHGIGPRDNFDPITIPENKFFVMGDNRDQSHDSRFWGLVDLQEIKGKALIIYWSWDPDDWVRFRRIGDLIE